MTAVLQPSLFDAPAPYQRSSDTSKAAARSLRSELAKLRRRVLLEYRTVGRRGMTPDVCAARLKLSVLSVRPRCTELYKKELLEKTGRRERNASQRWAHVLRAAKVAPIAPRNGSN